MNISSRETHFADPNIGGPNWERDPVDLVKLAATDSDIVEMALDLDTKGMSNPDINIAEIFRERGRDLLGQYGLSDEAAKNVLVASIIHGTQETRKAWLQRRSNKT